MCDTKLGDAGAGWHVTDTFTTLLITVFQITTSS